MSVSHLCQVAGISRQNYYKGRKHRSQRQVEEELVLELVRAERRRQPRLGGRKLLKLLEPELAEAQVQIGRDRFFALLAEQELLIERRPRQARTTNSWHGLGVYPNLAKQLELSTPHQLLLSDITYLRTLEGFMYLSLVMDGYSRLIVGYDCSDSLEMEGALRALEQALGQLPTGHQAMHHSDRGSQYCCGGYIKMLKEHGLQISMTQQNHCYENAKAERLNGILKQEYGLGQTLLSKAVALTAVSEAVQLYNRYRPHTSLGMRIPQVVHEGG